jgi:hypothetical protein
MKRFHRRLTRAAASRAGMLILAAVALSVPLAGPAHAQSGTTQFTYQGKLTSGSAAPTGLYDFRIRLFSTGTGGTQIGATACAEQVLVTDGLFTLPINFGAQFGTPAARFVEIEVRANTGLSCANTSGFTALTPRQQITPTPTAMHAYSAFALHAADGSPQNAVFVGNEGQVGINTVVPAHRLHVAGGTADQFTLVVENNSSTTGNAIRGVITAAASGNFSSGVTGVNSSVAGPTGGFGMYAVHTAGGTGIRAIGNGGGNGVEGFASGASSAGGYFRNDAGGPAIFADGMARVRTLQIIGGSDLAEPFDVKGEADVDIKAGMLVVIDPSNPGKLMLSSEPFDTKVAGAISGANGLSPGMVMRAVGEIHADGAHPVAMTGRVWVWCDAATGAIRPGDRLTTSATAGHAMRVGDEDGSRAGGAVVGKAMTELREGRGMVLVLINLQ